MAFSNAEKQQRYRERHLGVRGKKTRVQLFLSVTVDAQLRRLAGRKGYTVTKLIEELAASAERRTVARLSPQALKAYRRLRYKPGAACATTNATTHANFPVTPGRVAQMGTSCFFVYYTVTISAAVAE